MVRCFLCPRQDLKDPNKGPKRVIGLKVLEVRVYTGPDPLVQNINEPF